MISSQVYLHIKIPQHIVPCWSESKTFRVVSLWCFQGRFTDFLVIHCLCPLNRYYIKAWDVFQKVLTFSFIIFKEVHISNIFRNRIHFIKTTWKSSKVRLSAKHSMFFQSLQNNCTTALLKTGEQPNITWNKFWTVGKTRDIFETSLCQYTY